MLQHAMYQKGNTCVERVKKKTGTKLDPLRRVSYFTRHLDTTYNYPVDERTRRNETRHEGVRLMLDEKVCNIERDAIGANTQQLHDRSRCIPAHNNLRKLHGRHPSALEQAHSEQDALLHSEQCKLATVNHLGADMYRVPRYTSTPTFCSLRMALATCDSVRRRTVVSPNVAILYDTVHTKA